MITIAVLDKNNNLIGYTTKESIEKGDVEVPENCDLPVDGSYKWNGTTFLPPGFKFAKPLKPPIATGFAIYLMMEELIKEGFLKESNGCMVWFDWFKETMLERSNEKESEVK